MPLEFTAGIEEEDPEKTAADKAAEQIQHWDAEVCSNLMSTPQGRYWVERFLDFCCEDAELYRDDGDALGMAKRDGLAKAGRWIRIQLEAHCPDRLLQMIRERRGRTARTRSAIAEREAAAEPAEAQLRGITPIEELADEQARQAAEDAERERRKAKAEKKEK